MQTDNTPIPAVTENGESSLRDVLNALFRHRGKMILFFVVIVVLVTLATYLAQEIYQSNAKLLIRVGRENLAADPTVVGPTVTLDQNREMEVNTEIAILGSRDLAEEVVDAIGPARFLYSPDEEPASGATEAVRDARKVVRKEEKAASGLLELLDLKTPLTDREKAVKKVMKSLRIEPQKKSYIISVGLEAASPELARDALGKLVDSYIKRHIEAFAPQAKPKFFEDRSEEFLKDLAKKEKLLEDFRNQNAIATMEEQKKALILQVSGLQAEIDKADSEAGAAQAQIASVEKSLQAYSPKIELSQITGKTNFAADAMKSGLFDLRLKESELAAQYAPDFRLVKEAHERVKMAEDALAKEMKASGPETTMGLNEAHQTLALTLETAKGQFSAAQAKRESLAKALEERRGELKALADHEIGLNGLQRQVEVADGVYRQYNDNLKRATLANKMDNEKLTNVSVVQAPNLPFDPVRPRKLLNIALGILLGIIGSVALAFFMEYLDDSIKTNEDVKKRLNLPVLASVPLREA